MNYLVSYFNKGELCEVEVIAKSQEDAKACITRNVEDVKYIKVKEL